MPKPETVLFTFRQSFCGKRQFSIIKAESNSRVVFRVGRTVMKNSGFGLAPLEPEIINSAVGYNFNNDPFDGVITATAAELFVPLITKEAAITDSNLAEIYWLIPGHSK